MNIERFDDVTRALAARLPRRELVSVLAGAVLGRVALADADARKGRKKKGKKKKKKRPTTPTPTTCRFEKECPQRFALSRCCPGPDGLDFCFGSENRDPCPSECTGYDCPCRTDDDCPVFEEDEGPSQRGFCCKTCVYYGDPEFGTCLQQGSDLECIRCGQAPIACGDGGWAACYPDEACCLNAGGTGICCPNESQCSVSPTNGLPCCNQPNCLPVGEYRLPDTDCCCGIYDSTSSGGGQICCTRERGQSCSSSAECCPDFQGDTVCRNGFCVLPGSTGSDDDCPTARPFWCPPSGGRPGYCTNLETSRDNCGSCRFACLPAQTCLAGTCG
jgi:hypothetical protein